MKATEREDYFEFARRDHIPLLMISSIGRAFVQEIHAAELGINTSFSAYRRMFNGSSVPLGEWDVFKEEVRKLLRKGERLLDISNKHLFYVESMVTFAHKFHGKDLANYSNEELFKIIKEFHQLLLKLCGHFHTYFAISNYLPELIAARIRSNKDVIMHYATSPIHKTLVKESKENLLRICSLIDKNLELRKLFTSEKVVKTLPELLHNEIVNQNKKFGFINGYYLTVNWFTEDEIMKQIQSLFPNYREELRKIKEDEERNVNGAELAKRLDQKLLRLIKISKHFAWLAFYADEKVLLAFNYFKPVYTELARRNKLTYEEIIESTIDEIDSEYVPDKRVLRLRQNNYVFYCDRDQEYVFVGEEAKKIEQRQLDKEKELVKLKEVRGQPACVGVVRGTARIIKLRKDFDKVEKGDIIITFNTNPTYVPYLEKAAGLVTNEGGMLCHAAIVSREMNIPCVVGTINATKIFKDGEKIELDAKKGIVRKI